MVTLRGSALGQAEKEGDAAVKARLQSVLKVAMEEKQKTLRPEIQLLNRLLAVESSAQRKQARCMPHLSKYWKNAIKQICFYMAGRLATGSAGARNKLACAAWCVSVMSETIHGCSAARVGMHVLLAGAYSKRLWSGRC